jgi:hypothetical protein
VICKVEECERPSDSFGMCKLHAARFRRHGDPLAGRTKNGETLAFIELARTHIGDDCLIWPFATVKGYASMRSNGKTINVCRMLCVEVNGEPKGERKEACHSCGRGRTGCINPCHLRWGTRQDNVADAVKHGHTNLGRKFGKQTPEHIEKRFAWRKKETARDVNSSAN